MEEKTRNMVSNICTMLGASLLLYPLIDEATKALAPELEKLKSGDLQKEIPLLIDSHKDDKKDNREDKQEHHEPKQKQSEQGQSDHESDPISELAKLKKKLAEYEEKEKSKSDK